MSTVTVLPGRERRRRWTPAEKQRIVEESLTADMTVIFRRGARFTVTCEVA